MSSINPSQTLYIRNIKGRANVEEIRACLYGLFSTYGSILEIVTKKLKMREQAFVVYNNIASATTAKRGLTGFNFLGYPLEIEYAKTKSDAVAKLDGTYKLRIFDTSSKRAAEDQLEGNNAKMTKHDDDEDDSDDDDDHA
ncbi:unnamed protein product [Rhizopus microsporus]